MTILLIVKFTKTLIFWAKLPVLSHFSRWKTVGTLINGGVIYFRAAYTRKIKLLVVRFIVLGAYLWSVRVHFSPPRPHTFHLEKSLIKRDGSGIGKSGQTGNISRTNPNRRGTFVFASIFTGSALFIGRLFKVCDSQIGFARFSSLYVPQWSGPFF